MNDALGDCQRTIDSGVSASPSSSTSILTGSGDSDSEESEYLSKTKVNVVAPAGLVFPFPGFVEEWFSFGRPDLERDDLLVAAGEGH